MADGPLIAKWRKPGYEILCSMLAIQKNNHNFGTTSHCRVPMKLRAFQQRITPDVQTGCICCASGDGRFGGPIWWNTPIEEDTEETAEANRAVWGQEGEAPAAAAQGASLHALLCACRSAEDKRGRGCCGRGTDCVLVRRPHRKSRWWFKGYPFSWACQHPQRVITAPQSSQCGATPRPSHPL